MKPANEIPILDEERHEYTISGVVKPGVTDILQSVKPVKYRHNEVLMARGTYFHELCHREAKGILDHAGIEAEEDEVFRAEQMGVAAAYSLFLQEFGLGKEKPLCEQSLWHSDLDYCGTPDQVFFENNVLVDLKFGQKNKNHGLQLCAYHLLLINNYNIISNEWKNVVVYPDIDGSYKADVIKITAKLLNVWYSFINVWRW